MKIAVIGSGVAGLAAAWRLAERHDVIVYERDAEPGGHARTVDFGDVAVDIGFQLYHPQHNPNVRALFEAFEVEVEPRAFTLSSVRGEEAWTNNGHRTPLGDALAPEIARFLRDTPRMARLDMGVSLRQLFAERPYSPAFIRTCLLPLLSFFWVSRAALFEMPAAAVASGVREGALSFFAPTTWSVVRGGAREYVRRVAAALGDRVLLSTAAARVERRPDEVIVHDARGGARAFDHAVIAADGATALALLDAPTARERAALGSMRFETSTLIAHRDARVMPRDRALWSYGNYRDRGARDGVEGLHGEMTYCPDPKAITPALVTVATPETRIAKAKIVARVTWSHLVVDGRILARALPAAQGERRTWFCGGHTAGFPVHEHALSSGLAIAERLGASYPFARDERAREAYEKYRSIVV